MTAPMLPALSDPDPEIAGEGSLDPLGLAAIADRLADQLVPDVRARMSRVRFLTAVAVGATVTQELDGFPPGDDETLPSVCFEWHVIEAFVRRQNKFGALDASGVPGSQKASAVVRKGQRLRAGNYLKSPRVFGFFGVYLPLANGLRVADGRRLPLERCAELLRVWEREQDLDGFTDSTKRSPGGNMRRRLTEEVRCSYRAGHCTTSANGVLQSELAASLRPLGAQRSERALLRSWLLSPEWPIRAELATFVDRLGFDTEADVLRRVVPTASPELRARAQAALAYERVARILDLCFRQLCRASTLLGSQPLTPTSVSGDEAVTGAAASLPSAFAEAVDRLHEFDLGLMLESQLGQFASTMAPPDFVAHVLQHHERHQSTKPPHGKRPWLEPVGSGWVVRAPYRTGTTVAFDPDAQLLHPYRLTAMSQFLADTAP